MSHKKFGPDRFSRFYVYWIQTDTQTDKPNLYIDLYFVSIDSLDEDEDEPGDPENGVSPKETTLLTL